MHICVFVYIEFMHLVFLQNGENIFESLNKKGEKVFWGKEFWMFACFSHLVDAYIFV